MYVAVLVRARFDTEFFARRGGGTYRLRTLGLIEDFFLVGREGKLVDCMIVYDERE